MVIETHFLHCFFCGRRFSPGPDPKEGTFIQAWKVAACLRCVEGNQDGLSAKHPAVKQLARRGTRLDLPRSGIVPWPGNEGRRNPDPIFNPIVTRACRDA